MTPLQDFILDHCERGVCQCGRCLDAPENPEKHQPAGHTADVIFFQVRMVDEPDADELRKLIKSHVGVFMDVDLFDGEEHTYIELGAWIGDQGLALMLMGLGSLLGLWNLLTPRTLLQTKLIVPHPTPAWPDSLVMEMAARGLVTVQA